MASFQKKNTGKYWGLKPLHPDLGLDHAEEIMCFTKPKP